MEALEAWTVIDEPLRVFDDDERVTDLDAPLIDEAPTTIYDPPRAARGSQQKIPMRRDFAAPRPTLPPPRRLPTSQELDESYEEAMSYFM